MAYTGPAVFKTVGGCPTSATIRPFVLTGTQVSWHDSNGRTLVFESSDDGQSANFAQVGDEFNGAFFPG